MPSIEFFRCNVRHAAILVIFFSFSPPNSPHFSFHLPTFREYSFCTQINFLLLFYYDIPFIARENFSEKDRKKIAEKNFKNF